MTRINNSNIQGLSSIIERKKSANVYPQIGHFFTNVPESKAEQILESNKDSDPLLVNLFEHGQTLTSNLKSINLQPQSCYKDIEPINLYHKVGHGTLDMYVISPSKESKEVKEFLHKWNARDQALFANKSSKEFQFPLQNLVSICAMLVWQPANPDETITRILFPGSTPDFKIIEGLDKLKHLEFMKHPVCTANQIETSLSSSILTKTTLKSALADKTTQDPILPSKMIRTSAIQEKGNKMIETKAANAVTEKEKIITDENAKLSNDDKIDAKSIEAIAVDKPTEDNKPAKVSIEKDNKTLSDAKPIVRARVDSRPPKSMDRKLKKDSSTEKKDISKASPSTTPKKELKSTKDKEVKSKVISRITKSSPSSTPAKSTKEANNRKVLESKQKTVKTLRKEVTVEKKELKTERKSISRRPKPSAGSPIKSIKPKAIRKPEKAVALDTNAIPTDDKIEKNLDQDKQIILDDLKEEEEAVREIEAVLQRSEHRKIDNADHRAVIDKQDSTTEAEEEEEYIIIEKEEQYTEDSINEPESSEIQKHQRDSQESEKKRKPSMETTEEEILDKSTELEKQDVAVDDEKRDSLPKIETDEKEIKTPNGDIPTQKRDSIDAVKIDSSPPPISDEKHSSDGKKPIDVKEELTGDKAKEIEIANPPEVKSAESGATTAPTLPEDERVTMDEIKEDVIEEKYIKEETKETQVIVTSVDDTPIERQQPKPMQFDAQKPHIRDIIKTPDEVADLPVHEEADLVESETKKTDTHDTKIDEKTSTQVRREREPSVTKIEDAKDKVDASGKTIEYKLEELGQQFENTLKDVTEEKSGDEKTDMRKESIVEDKIDIVVESVEDVILPTDSRKESLIEIEKISISPKEQEQEDEIKEQVYEMKGESPVADVDAESKDRKESLITENETVDEARKSKSPTESIGKDRKDSLLPDEEIHEKPSISPIDGSEKPLDETAIESKTEIADEKIKIERKESLITETEKDDIKEFSPKSKSPTESIGKDRKESLVAEDIQRKASLSPAEQKSISPVDIKEQTQADEAQIAESDAVLEKEERKDSLIALAEKAVEDQKLEVSRKDSVKPDSPIKDSHDDNKEEISISPTEQKQVDVIEKESPTAGIDPKSTDRKDSLVTEQEIIDESRKSKSPTESIGKDQKDSLLADKEIQEKPSTSPIDSDEKPLDTTDEAVIESKKEIIDEKIEIERKESLIAETEKDDIKEVSSKSKSPTESIGKERKESLVAEDVQSKASLSPAEQKSITPIDDTKEEAQSDEAHIVESDTVLEKEERKDSLIESTEKETGEKSPIDRKNSVKPDSPVKDLHDDGKEQISISPVSVDRIEEKTESRKESIVSVKDVAEKRLDSALSVESKKEDRSISPSSDDGKNKVEIADTTLVSEEKPIANGSVPKERKESLAAENLIEEKSISPSADRKESLISEKAISPDDDQKYTEVYDYSHPFAADEVTHELRETHITTIESPLTEKSKLIDLEVIEKPLSTTEEYKFGFEESTLNDIKEEDEERISPREENGKINCFFERKNLYANK